MIIWDENIVYFFNWEKTLLWTNKKFIYLIFINKLLWYHPKITYENIVQKDMHKFNVNTQKTLVQTQHVESTKKSLFWGVFDIKISWYNKETAVICKNSLPDMNWSHCAKQTHFVCSLRFHEKVVTYILCYCRCSNCFQFEGRRKVLKFKGGK